MLAAMRASEESAVFISRTRTVPDSSPLMKCGITPEQMWSSVDLPHPVGPTMATTSPSETVRLTSCRSGRPPGKAKPTPSRTIASMAGVRPILLLLCLSAAAAVREVEPDRNGQQDDEAHCTDAPLRLIEEAEALRKGA